MRILDGKFHLEGEKIIKTSNGEEVNLEEEPVVLFRARDYLAVPTLEYYRQLCTSDLCTDYQLKVLDQLIERFKVFKVTKSEKMKQPGITRGL